MIHAAFDPATARPIGTPAPRGGPALSIRFATLLGAQDVRATAEPVTLDPPASAPGDDVQPVWPPSGNASTTAPPPDQFWTDLIHPAHPGPVEGRDAAAGSTPFDAARCAAQDRLRHARGERRPESRQPDHALADHAPTDDALSDQPPSVGPTKPVGSAKRVGTAPPAVDADPAPAADATPIRAGRGRGRTGARKPSGAGQDTAPRPPLAKSIADDLVAMLSASGSNKATVQPSAAPIEHADEASIRTAPNAAAAAVHAPAPAAPKPSARAPKAAVQPAPREQDAGLDAAKPVETSKAITGTVQTRELTARAIAEPASPSSPAAAVAPDAVARQLDLAQGSAWLDRLAADIAASAGGGDRLRFSLAPERLGKLTVDLANAADGTAIRFTTETREAHRILSDARPQLVAEARAQGLRIAEAQVDLAAGRSGDQPSGADARAGAGQSGNGQRHAAAAPHTPAPPPRAQKSSPAPRPDHAGPAASDLFA